MSVGECCREHLVTAAPGESVREAALRMETQGVGCVVVVDLSNRPIGMLTDRDIAMRVLRRERDPDATAVSDVMESDLTTIRSRSPLVVALRRMRVEGFRRLPVIDDEGCLCGLITLDDALQILSSELSSAAAVSFAQFPTPSETQGGPA